MKEKRKTKNNKHIICNTLLIISLISAVTNFIINILCRNNKDILINIVSSILLCIFVIFYIISSITNNKRNKSSIVISSIVLILFNIVQISNNLNLVSPIKINTIPDFQNKSLIDVIKWSEKNKVKIDQIYEYSDTIDEYKIINQNKKDISTKGLKSLTVSVSEGPNPDKEVILPDMETWDADRVLSFIKKNFLNNVNIEFILSDKERDTVIEQSKSGTIKRSDELKLTFSLGEEEGLEEVKLIDLTNKSQFEAEFYLKRHAIKYDIEKEFSNKITRNNVISTNKKIGTKLKPNSDEDKLILKISKGKKIKVPDLKKYSMLEITKWVIENKLKLEFSNRYDDSIKTNKVIDVNYNNGDEIEEKTLIKVTISKGKLVMLSFDSLDEFKSWANKYNINYEEKFEFSNEIPKGKVIKYSHASGSEVGENATITLTLSNGKKPVNNNSSSSNKHNNQGSNSGNTKPQETCDRSKTITITFQGSLNGSSLSDTSANYRRAYPNIKFSFVGKASDIGNNGMVHKDSTSKGSFEANYCDTYTIYIVQN